MNSPLLPPEDLGPEPGEPPTDEVLAGEYVLGVLDAARRQQVQIRLETDRAFAQRVQEWERHFAPLLSEIPPVEAPERIWTAVCQRLGWAERTRPTGFWRSLGFWRAATALSIVVAIAAIAFSVQHSLTPAPQIVAQLPPPESGAKPVTPLDHDDGTPGWLASVDPARGTVLMVPVPAAPDARGRVPELWLIAAGKAPVSLGAVSINQAHTVTVPQSARAALVVGSTLAITMEPAAGIPHAAPSSAVIAKGTIQTLPAAS